MPLFCKKTKNQKIANLKAEARRHYIKATTRPLGMHGGWSMVEMLRPDIAVARQNFNTVMNNLAMLDPDTPEERL